MKYLVTKYHVKAIENTPIKKTRNFSELITRTREKREREINKMRLKGNIGKYYGLGILHNEEYMVPSKEDLVSKIEDCPQKGSRFSRFINYASAAAAVTFMGVVSLYSLGLFGKKEVKPVGESKIAKKEYKMSRNNLAKGYTKILGIKTIPNIAYVNEKKEVAMVNLRDKSF